MFRSIRVRLTLWYVLLVAVILAAFSVAIYSALHEALYSNLDDSLDNRADLAISQATGDDGRLKDPADIDIPGDPFESEHFTRIFDADGNVIFDNSPSGLDVPINPNALELARLLCDDCGDDSTRWHADTGEGLRVLTRPIVGRGGIIGVVEVGLSEGDQRDTLNQLLIILLVAFPLTLALASVGGVFLAGRALRPVDELTNVARQITAEDLSKRLDMKLPDDEVGRLARTFDEMIARLDDAFRRQRQFTADASHELRTPLTSIKGQTEVALQRDRDSEDYREVLRAVNTEVDRMIRLVGSLLTLARADSRLSVIAHERIDLAQLANDAVDQMSAAAGAKTISLKVDAQPTQMTGDEDLLLQLLLNLLDNAVKYTPEGGSVTISCKAEPGSAVIQVSDTGTGIDEEHLPRIFDRFYRVDQSRAGGGAGLGLSISRWIAEAHGGSLTAESEPGYGSTFTVRLPLSVN